MNETTKQRDVERRAARAFEASVAEIDSETRAKLGRARRAALASAQAEMPWLADARRYAWVPAGVAVALLAVWALQSPAPSEDGALTAATVDDLDILLAEEDLAVFEELDFYTWLEEQPEAQPPEPGGDGVG